MKTTQAEEHDEYAPRVSLGNKHSDQGADERGRSSNVEAQFENFECCTKEILPVEGVDAESGQDEQCERQENRNDHRAREVCHATALYGWHLDAVFLHHLCPAATAAYCGNRKVRNT